MRFYTLSNKKTTGEPQEKKRDEKLIAIIEFVVIVFLTSFIPALIKLGRPPTSIEEVWAELLAAILASIYAYIRIKGINVEAEG